MFDANHMETQSEIWPEISQCASELGSDQSDSAESSGKISLLLMVYSNYSSICMYLFICSFHLLKKKKKFFLKFSFFSDG